MMAPTDIPALDERTRRLFEIEARLDPEYDALGKRIDHHLDAMQAELERLLDSLEDD
jgi:hypothetical protein